MPFLVGTDEAGYGPNLGPLVITATVWRVDSLRQRDLFARLRTAVSASPTSVADGKLPIGDSKQLYKPGKGLQLLETGVFACLAAVEKHPRTWRAIWRDLCADEGGYIGQLPWYRDFDDALPVDLDANGLVQQAQSFRQACARARCRLTHVESRAIFPDHFNALVDEHGNKAFALSLSTLDLVRSVLDLLPADEAVYVLCDKHGGRNRYGPLLNQIFPETLAVVRAEGRSASSYQLGSGKSRREFVFQAQGESFLPSALSSMISKYLRELAMRAFNHFWVAHRGDLSPTAGYPVDAKRFKAEIAPIQRKLGIEDRILWRCR